MGTTTNPTRTKKFKALVAVLGSEEAAVAAWNAGNPDNQIGGSTPVSTEVQTLIDAGFTREEAEKYAAQAAAPAPAAPLTSQELAEVEIAKQGFVPVRGRVYGNTALVEAQVRVLKSGKPEVVRLEGEHRVKAVAVWRTDDGKTFATQNLSVPN